MIGFGEILTEAWASVCIGCEIGDTRNQDRNSFI